MSDDLKSALIAGTVALFVAFLSAIANILTNKKIHNDNKELLKQTQHESKRIGVTQQRMKWISEIREIFAHILCYDLLDIKLSMSTHQEFSKTVQLLKLYLNFGSKFDNKILDSLDEMLHTAYTATLQDDQCGSDFCDLDDTFKRNKAEIQKYAHIYLKSEWNRVKFESDPQNYDKEYNEKENLDLLANKYDESLKYLQSRHTRYAQELRDLLSKKINEYR